MRHVLAALIGLSVMIGQAYAGVSPAQKCAVAKNKATGKKIAAKLKCHQKAILSGLAVDSACLMKAEDKFSAAIASAEAKGGCVTVGDQVTLEAAADDCVDVVAGLTTPTTTSTSTITNASTTTIATTTTANSTTSTTTLPPCRATTGGFCWFKGVGAANCTSTCAGKGRVYDSATDTYAGSGGTDAHCAAVALAVVGINPSSYGGSLEVGGVGCFVSVETGLVFRDITPTTAAGSDAVAERFCACK